MIVLIKQLYVDIAGKNFTVTKMGRMRERTIFVRLVSLSNTQDTVRRENSVSPSHFSFSGMDFHFIFLPNLSPAEKKKQMEEYMTKRMSFPLQRATGSGWTLWMKKNHTNWENEEKLGDSRIGWVWT